MHRLTQLERQKIIDELKALQERIKELEEILASEARVKHIITDELRDLQKRFGDERRTKILGAIEEARIEDLVQVQVRATSA